MLPLCAAEEFVFHFRVFQRDSIMITQVPWYPADFFLKPQSVENEVYRTHNFLNADKLKLINSCRHCNYNNISLSCLKSSKYTF